MPERPAVQERPGKEGSRMARVFAIAVAIFEENQGEKNLQDGWLA